MDDIWISIFDFCNVSDYLVIGRCCKHFKKLTDYNYNNNGNVNDNNNNGNDNNGSDYSYHNNKYWYYQILRINSCSVFFYLQQIPLREGTDITEVWRQPPVRPLLKIYFFNVTNPRRFLRGAKPRLQEVGPFVYE